jgi:hypothetical protein
MQLNRSEFLSLRLSFFDTVDLLDHPLHLNARPICLIETTFYMWLWPS